MRNVEITRKAEKLIIEIDLAEKGEPSASGKSIVIASTEGNKRIPAEDSDKGQEIFLGLNVYKK